MTEPNEVARPIQRLTLDSLLAVPAIELPNARTEIASQAGVLSKLIFVTWGGLGDQICAEPTIRFALRRWPELEISLAGEQPDLFRHLKFADVFDLRREQPIWPRYLQMRTIYDQTKSLHQEFVAHMLTNCVDYVSIATLRCQLPTRDREIKLVPPDDAVEAVCDSVDLSEKLVAIHAGKHWQSKTFPKDWWDAVLARLVQQGAKPVLIGADTDDNRSTVDVCTDGCLDLRNKLSIMESVALLQRVKVLLTNDSAPLHMAASGDAWIGFVATCKAPDLITHWRHGEWSWRMKDFSRNGGMWELLNWCPNKDGKLGEVSAEFVPEDTLRSWLPDPVDFADWGAARARE